MLVKDVLNDISSSVQQTYVRTTSQYGKSGSVTISVMMLTNDSFGPRFIKANEDMLQQQSYYMIDAEYNRTSNFSIVEFEGIKADIARLLSFDVQHSNGASTLNVSLRVLRGNVLIEISDDRINLDDKALTSIVEEIFKRIEKNTDGSSSN